MQAIIDKIEYCQAVLAKQTLMLYGQIPIPADKQKEVQAEYDTAQQRLTEIQEYIERSAKL